MNMNQFKITGRIVDPETNAGIPDIHIEAWDKDLIFDDLLGSADTDADGRFNLRFDESYFKELIQRRPDLNVKLFQAGVQIPAEQFELTLTLPDGSQPSGDGRQVFQWLAPGETQALIRLPLAVVHGLLKVSGKVTQPDGTPAAGVLVRAVDKDLRHEEPLGETTTDDTGVYTITYTADQFKRAEKGFADLIVRAYAGDGAELAASEILFNADPRAVVDLTLSGEGYQRPSDYETLVAALTLVLDGVHPGELTDEDISFLAGETEIERSRIQALQQAAKLAVEIDHPDLPTEVFYGFARKGLPAGSRAELLARPLSVLMQHLEQVLEENIIPASLGPQFDAIKSALQALMIQQAGEEPAPDTTSFAALLETCPVLDEQKRQILLEFLTTYRGSIVQFWTALEQGTDLTSAEIEGARFTLQFGVLSRNHLPMVDTLQRLRTEAVPGFSEEPIQSIRELAQFTSNDWEGLITDPSNDPPIGFPPDTPGDDDAEKAKNYAWQIFCRIGEVFPTAATAYCLAEADPVVWNHGQQLSDFLLDNPDFDLNTTRIEPYLTAEPRRLGAVTGSGNADDFKQELKTLQRLFQVTTGSAQAQTDVGRSGSRPGEPLSRFEQINRLQEKGFGSARSIARVTRNSFMSRYGSDLGGAEAAASIHATACERVSAATAIWGNWCYAFHQVRPAMIPPPPAPEFLEADIPNWSELFGAVDYCDCRHCRSIYSPAAYFVDLLLLLKNESTYQGSAANGKENGLDALLQHHRRPDLQHIELTCANTNTPLPYVDLVNEILERAIASDQQTPWPQTTWTAEALAANPEHISAAPYEQALNRAIYPWTLPFHLYSEEARIYLRHLGVPRYKVMEVFFHQGGDSISPRNDDTPSPMQVYLDPNIAREYLSMPVAEWKLLSGRSHPQETQWPDLWGLSDNALLETPKETIRGPWHEVLSCVSILLQRSGLSLDELKTLLQLRTINPHGHIALQGEGRCSIVDLRLVFSGDTGQPTGQSEAPSTFRRLCLFVRLYRRLGWRPAELEQAIVAFTRFGRNPEADRDDPQGAEAWSVDEDVLIQLSHVQRLQERFGLPLNELLCWWGNIPTTAPDDAQSLFERLFLNNAVLPKAASESWQAFEDLLQDPNPSQYERISGHLPLLAAAFGANSDDILWLMQWQPPWTPEPQSASSDELPPYWDRLTLGNLSRLHRILSLCRAFSLSVQSFASLIEMRGPGLDPFPPLLMQPTERLLVLTDDLKRHAGSGFTIVELDHLLRHRFQSPENAQASLRDDTLFLDRLAAELTKIDPELLDEEGRRVIKQHFTNLLNIDPAIIERLLEGIGEGFPHVRSWIRGAGSGWDSIEVFLDSTFLNEYLSEGGLIKETFADQKTVRDNLEEQYQTLTKLRKAGLLISRLQLTMKEAAYLFHTHKLEWFDLNELPFADQTRCDKLYADWSRLVALCGLRDRIGTTAPDLFDLFDMAGTDALPDDELFSEVYSQRLHWPNEDFAALRDRFGHERKDFLDEHAFLRIEACFALARRVGQTITRPTDPEGMLAWAADTVTAKVAADIKLAAKSRHDEDRWRTVAKPLQDGLREARRRALVAYLTGVWNWTPEQLYAYFLIDVDMQPCMMTSRIKQAVSSVQLFIQRCLLGLEEDVQISSDGAQWWRQWMKTYRVWEANRKIFTYPENWIEPELRDDKSPFFEELERELRQNEITPETVETAYFHYLEKLDRVSRLEIVAQYYDSDSGRHYLFGRTPSTPHVYFFRFRDDCRVWSPWEQIDLDIDSDHLIPVVWNRRLYLFWPIFKEVSKKQDTPEADKPYGQTEKVWEIKMAWSEYWQGKWGQKKVMCTPLRPSYSDSSGIAVKDDYSCYQGLMPIPTPYFEDKKDSILFCFSSSKDDTGLNISVFYPPSFFARWAPQLRGLHVKAGEFIFTGNSGVPRRRENAPWEYRQLPITKDGYVSGSVLRACGGAVYFRLPSGEQLSQGDIINYDNLIPSINFWAIPESKRGQSEFRLIFPHAGPVSYCDINFYRQAHFAYIGWASPIAYQDESHSFMIQPLLEDDKYLYTQTSDLQCLVDYDSSWFVGHNLQYCVESLYHPYAGDFIASLYQVGIDGLLSPLDTRENSLFRQKIKKDIFGPEESGLIQIHDHVVSHPKEEITFEDEEAYALYNWELFFHIPLLIADRLSANQQFEAAQKWFHYIFDPTEVIPSDDPSRGAWRFGPFFDAGDNLQRIEELMLKINGGAPEFADRVRKWRENPFQPHLIARLRDGWPYMKTVVMKYIDNLIAWGDTLFRRDSIESINEATQLYLLAAAILGPSPQRLPELSRAAQTYAMLADRIDAFGNALVPIENELVEAGENEAASVEFNLLPQMMSYEVVLNPQLWAQPAIYMTAAHQLSDPDRRRRVGGLIPTRPLAATRTSRFLDPNEQVGMAMWVPPPTLYFCIPPNDKLSSYWDTVADRLFKIRHCMNIEGIVRELPLFEPPIEPGLLVRAAAAGIDLSSIVSEPSPAMPHYRFNIILQKALELCADVKALGAALLSAFEKRDAEALGLLRSTHELRVLEAVREIKERQVEETQASVQALERALESAELQREHYASLEFVNAAERQHLNLLGISMGLEQQGSFLKFAASSAAHAPDVTTGYVCMGGTATAGTGGSKAAKALEAVAWYFSAVSNMLRTAGTQSATLGSHQRRKEEWDFKKDTAAIEVKQIEKQLIGANIRQEIAKNELKNHKLQTTQAEEINEELRTKFTKEELYDRMISQISQLYFRSYELAYDLAKQAELCYQYERGLQQSSFIAFGYWDNLKKGLLSGEKLHFDLKRLEAAYLEQNKRDFELTKHVSLLQVAPDALLLLKTTGSTGEVIKVILPEELFDMDTPGHFFRRIKSVAVTIPCVTGPYVGVHCRVTLTQSSIRISPVVRSGNGSRDDDETGFDGYARDEAAGMDERFVDDYVGVGGACIVTSSGDNDSGLFETNLHDERYLPFEGAGVISEWRLDLPDEPRQFDYDTISDVILHIRYTARDGGETLRSAAKAHLQTAIDQGTAGGSVRLFSIRHEFPGDWARFKAHAENEAAQASDETRSELAVTFKQEHYPFWSRAGLGTVKAIQMLAAAEDIGNQDIPVYKNGEEVACTLSQGSLGPLFFNQDGACTDLLLAPYDEDLSLWFDAANAKSITDLWVAVHWGA